MNEPQQNQQGAPETRVLNPFETLAGYSFVEVDYLDGSREKVKVRQIRVRELEPFMQIVDHETKVVSLLTERPIEWCDSLTHDSFTRLVTECYRVAAPPFFAYLRRFMERTEMGRQCAPTTGSRR